MKITIIQIGKTKHSFIKEAEHEYLKRLAPYAEVECVVLKDEADAEKILKTVGYGLMIALDETGKQITSVEFGNKIQQWQDEGVRALNFIIGGAYGLPGIVKKEADFLLSLSKMTFTHEMIRPFLLEQIYRAFMINNKKPYHH